MTSRLLCAAVVALVVCTLTLGAERGHAVPMASERRLHPADIPPQPSYVQTVEKALVGLKVQAREDSPSSRRLGSQRVGTAVIFDARGYAVTVSYVTQDAVRIEAHTRDGRVVPAKLVGMDLDAGLAVIHLDGAGPWTPATFGASRDVEPGTVTGTVAVDEDGDLVYAASTVQAIRRFSAFWEYMLDRAFLVAPAISSWGGAAVVDAAGRVIGIASLRLGEAPYVNLAIPVEKFVPVKDELISAGRVVSRRPRAWLGLNTSASERGVVVESFNEAGPARGAGFRPGDRIIRVDGVAVRSQEEFYEQLWRREAGDTIEVAVVRGDAVRVITVRSSDRHRVFVPTQ